LEEILRRCGERLEVHVLFYIPAGYRAEWAHTDLWERAAALQGMQLWTDEEGKEGQRFGAATSGHAVLYGPDGGLLFRGGITAARGHVGDNDGCEAVIAHVLRTTATTSRTDVFGCPLVGRYCKPPEELDGLENRPTKDEQQRSGKAVGANTCGNLN
jgi:hypothetical protein